MRNQREILLCRAEAAGQVMAALMPKERTQEPEVKPPWEVLEFEDAETGGSCKIAVVRASGVMALGVSGWYGCCDLQELAEEIEEADRDANISAIIVHIDSPGGTVNGTPEAASRIAAVDKPMLVWTEREMCSAAYWVAASADVIAAAPSAMVGSIGCVLAHDDYSGMLENAGIKIRVFRSGELKAAGMAGTTLTEAEAAHFQQLVDEIGTDFSGWVYGLRETLDASLVDGRAVTAKAGLALGIVDVLHNTMEEAVADFVAAFVQA